MSAHQQILIYIPAGVASGGVSLNETPPPHLVSLYSGVITCVQSHTLVLGLNMYCLVSLTL
jgi:hypothetical protein